MTERKMPNFATHANFKVSDADKARHKTSSNRNPLYGFGGDKSFLPLKVRNDLLRWVKGSSLSPGQQEKLVDFANDLAQRPDTGAVPIDAQRNELEALAKCAHALLNGLNSISHPTLSALDSYARETRLKDSPTPPLPADMTESMTDFLSELWISAECLERAADYTREQLGSLASRDGKPVPAQQRSLVANLASRHYQLNGKLPPKDDASWFASFVRDLGAFMGLHDDDVAGKSKKGKAYIGSGILKSGIGLATKVDKEMEDIGAGDLAEARARPLHCNHDWPLPVSSLAPQNCRECGGGRNGAPDITP